MAFFTFSVYKPFSLRNFVRGFFLIAILKGYPGSSIMFIIVTELV